MTPAVNRVDMNYHEYNIIAGTSVLCSGAILKQQPAQYRNQFYQIKPLYRAVYIPGKVLNKTNIKDL